MSRHRFERRYLSTHKVRVLCERKIFLLSTLFNIFTFLFDIILYLFTVRSAAVVKPFRRHCQAVPPPLSSRSAAVRV